MEKGIKRGGTAEQAQKKKPGGSQQAVSTAAGEEAQVMVAGEETPGKKPAAAAGESVEELRQQLAEANDRCLRVMAELDNYRKRAQREFTEIRHSTRALTIQEFFTAFDHFQMAMAHADSPEGQSQLETLRTGMQMILGEFQRAFENLGVEKITGEGAEFDPNLHEAIAQEPSDSVPAGHVIRQWKCGYKIGDRLLRPATVVVSSGPADDDTAN
jgi:molecular chaperone GrpE